MSHGYGRMLGHMTIRKCEGGCGRDVDDDWDAHDVTDDDGSVRSFCFNCCPQCTHALGLTDDEDHDQ